MSNIEEAREFFKNDLFASQQVGIEIIAAEPGYAKCSLKIEDRHKNAMGYVMGGVYFTMADYAFAIAANFKQPPTVTQTSQIAYLAAAKGGTLYAETERIKAGRSTCFYRVAITDDSGTALAYVTMTGFVLR